MGEFVGAIAAVALVLLALSRLPPGPSEPATRCPPWLRPTMEGTCR